MRNPIRSLAVVLALCATPAVAQVPPFPQTLPSNSVVGRLGNGTSGPSQAIPFSVFGTNIVPYISPALAGNPTASIGLTAINGTASTFIRTDGAPALSQAIAPTWTGQHTWSSGGLLMTGNMPLTQVFAGGGVPAKMWMNTVGTASSATIPEIAHQVFITSAIGSANPAVAYKVAESATMSANTDTSAHAYVRNDILDLGGGSNANFFGTGYEVDININSAMAYGQASFGTQQALYGIVAVASGNGQMSATYWATGNHLSAAYAAYAATGNFIGTDGAGFYDNTNSPNVLLASGSHTNGVNLFAATLSGAAFIAPNNNGLYASNAAANASIPLVRSNTSDEVVLGDSVHTSVISGLILLPQGKVIFANIAAPSTPTSGTTSWYTDSGTKVPSAKNDAGTVYTMVSNSACSTHQFAVGISAGSVSCAQPSGADLSDTTGSGNVVLQTSPAITGAWLFTATSAPATPSSGVARFWIDSTDKRFHDKNDAGAVGTTVVSAACGSNQFTNNITVAGVIGCAQPSVSNISGFGTGVATWLGTPSSANLATALTDETGSGAVVFATSPTLVTPTLGVATATSLKTASIFPPSDSTTALQIFKADGSTRVVAIDTTNARVGINKTAGSFDLDVNGAANVGGALTFGTATITGLTNKASPNATDDYVIIYDNAGTAVKKATTGSIAASGGAGTVSSVVCQGLTISTTGSCPEPFGFENISLAASVGSNILTVALKDASGSNCSATSVCRIAFGNVTATTGSTTFQSVTGALSVDTNATGASLGSSNSTAFRLWVVAFDNGGTVALSLYNASTAAGCRPINEGVAQSSTAFSGSANSAGVYYTQNGTTVSSKSIKILGYVEYNSSGLATAGTYASGPNFIRTFGPGIKKPCETVQSLFSTSSTDATATSTTKVQTNLSQAITLTSAANLVRANSGGTLRSTGSATTVGYARMSRGASPTLFGSTCAMINTGGNEFWTPCTMLGVDKPNTTSATTYYVYIWAGAAITGIVFPTFTTSSGDSIGAMTVDEIQGALPEPANDNIHPGVFSRVG